MMNIKQCTNLRDWHYFGLLQVSTVFVAPPVLVYFAKMQNKEGYDLSSVRALVCGGAPLSKEVNDAVCTMFKFGYVTEGTIFEISFQLITIIYVSQYFVIF